MSTEKLLKPTPPEGIPYAPAPWVLRGQAFIFAGINFTAPTNLPNWTFHPHEANSSFNSPASGKPAPGVGTLMIIRYHDSPAGPYDELLYSPSYFEYPFEEKNGKMVLKRALRITHIYVSQPRTCWNGRTLWNIPKHLADFNWVTDPKTKATTVTVSPTNSPPIFRGKLSYVSYVPTFPFNSAIVDPFGFLLDIVGPPLPSGDKDAPEIAGTNKWCYLRPKMCAKHTNLIWGEWEKGENMIMGDGLQGWWPSMGFVLEDLVLDFPEGQYWEA